MLCDGSVHDERTTAMNDRSGDLGVAATMTSWSAWGQSSDCWAVICKNVRFHRHANVNSGHKIPPGETDAVISPPAITGLFVAVCDECGKECSYRADEVVRVELPLPESFRAPAALTELMNQRTPRVRRNLL